MKKGSLLTLVIFSSFIIVGFILSIVSAATVVGSVQSNSETGASSGIAIAMVASVLITISTIGTLVSGIIVTVQAGKLNNHKGLTRSSGILAIVGGGLGVILAWAAGSVGAIIACICIIVTFGLSTSAFVKIKKEQGFAN